MLELLLKVREYLRKHGEELLANVIREYLLSVDIKVTDKKPKK